MLSAGTILETSSWTSTVRASFLEATPNILDIRLWYFKNLCNITLWPAVLFQSNSTGCVQFINYHNNDLVISKMSKKLVKSNLFKAIEEENRTNVHKMLQRIFQCQIKLFDHNNFAFSSYLRRSVNKSKYNFTKIIFFITF